MSKDLDWAYGPMAYQASNAVDAPYWNESQQALAQQIDVYFGARNAERPRYYFWLGKDGE